MLSLSLLPLFLQAQRVELIDIVHLTNGETVEGNIVQLIPKESLTLRNLDGLELTFPIDQVERVVQAKQRIIKQVTVQPKEPIQDPKTQGWYNLTHVGMLNGKGRRTTNFSFSVNNVTGHLFKRWLGVGLGVGIDAYSTGTGENIYPIFIEARGYLQEKPNSFFYALQTGYGMAFKNANFFVSDAEGGFMYQAAAGYRIATREALQILLTIGTRFQSASFVRQEPIRGGEESLTLQYRRVIMGVGIQF
ncbi:MAG: hypothetical protein AB8G22_29500 [Saprospiraceae bacterium]